MPYKFDTELLQFEKVANCEKQVPLNWINKKGNYITNECIEYLRPLIQGEISIPVENGIPRYANLKKYLSKKNVNKPITKCYSNIGVQLCTPYCSFLRPKQSK